LRLAVAPPWPPEVVALAVAFNTGSLTVASVVVPLLENVE
jgi:hypothetical protein